MPTASFSSPRVRTNLSGSLTKFARLVCVLGTKFGIKGVENLAEGTCEKITELVDLRESTGLSFEIEADGAIRRYTVPRLRRAGVDVVVPGSLMFDGDCAKTSQWLEGLTCSKRAHNQHPPGLSYTQLPLEKQIGSLTTDLMSPFKIIRFYLTLGAEDCED